TSAPDTSGNNRSGTLINGPVWTTGKINGAVSLDGVDDYVSLATGVMATLTTSTFSAWVNLTASSNWARIFDFGTGTATNMFLTAKNGSNGFLRFAIKVNNSAEQQINSTYTFPLGTWVHVAVTLNGALGIMYVNGTEVGRNASMTFNPSSLGSTNLNYLGKSQYADPYLNGKIDDFRIYSRA